VSTFGQQAEDIYRVLDRAIEHSDLIKVRKAVDQLIELAVQNIQEDPTNLGAVHILVDTFDDVGNIESFKSIGMEESPFLTAESAMLDLLRAIPTNLIRVASKKVQAVIYVAQRDFAKAVALGDDAAFAMALALRAQMGPLPRQMPAIMQALTQVDPKAVHHALGLVQADARGSDFDNWERNFRNWFASVEDPAAVAAVAKRMEGGVPRLVGPIKHAYERLLELRSLLGKMDIVPEPENSSLRASAGPEASASGPRLCSFAPAIMAVFHLTCGPSGDQYSIATPSTSHLVVSQRTGLTTTRLPGLEVWRLDRDEYVVTATA
jgi:hypothetical protein